MKEHIWTRREIISFMENETDFEPGVKQGVMGDIGVENDIQENKCEEHKVDLMFDDENEFYYCPLCEK